MADIVNTGATANDGSGDPLRTAFQLINERLQQLLGTLSQITWAPGLSITATPLRQWTVVAGQAYVAASNHTAGATFAADLAAGRWLAVDVAQLIADLNSAAPGFGGAMVRLEDGRTIQDAMEFDWSAAPGATNELGYGIRTASTAYNVLRNVPLTEWAAILNGTSTYNATTAIQSALTAGGEIYIPGGLWNVDPLITSTTIPTTITLGAGCRLYARAGYGTNDCLLTIGSGADVTIYAGSGAEVRMRKADYTTGEWRHGVNIFGAKKAHIYGLLSADSGGDCFYVGGGSGDPSEDVLLFDCVGDNGRRQGLSIVNAVKCHVRGGTYKNTAGTAPQAGIDVESNLLPGYFLSDILIDGAHTENNTGAGLLITPQSMANPVNIVAVNCTSTNDGGLLGGLALNAAMAYRTNAPVTDPANIGKIHGRVFVDNMTIINPKGRGIGMTNWGENAPDTELGTITVINPCSDAAYDTSDIHRCALLVRSELGSGGRYTTGVGHVTVRNLIAIDNRATKKMVIPLYVNMADEAAQPFTRFCFLNIDAVQSEWTSGSVTPILFAATKALNCCGSYHVPRYVSAGSGTTITFAQAGCTLYPPGAASYTLPLVTNYPGTEVEVMLRTGSLNLTPNAADTIDIYSGGVAGNPATSSTVGSRLRVRATDSGRWEVVNVVGTWS